MRSRAGRLGVVADWELIEGWAVAGAILLTNTLEHTTIAPDV